MPLNHDVWNLRPARILFGRAMAQLLTSGCSLLLTLHVVNFSHLDEIARMSLRLWIRLTTFLSQLKELTANGA